MKSKIIFINENYPMSADPQKARNMLSGMSGIYCELLRRKKEKCTIGRR